MAIPRAEKAYEKHAWIILLALGLPGLFFGFRFIVTPSPPDPVLIRNLTGMNWAEIAARSPGVAELMSGILRAFGASLVGVSVFGMAIALVSYRKGEKWAWYVSWYLPVFYLGSVANNLSGGGSVWPLFLALALIATVGLLLPYRKFFLKKPLS